MMKKLITVLFLTGFSVSAHSSDLACDGRFEDKTIRIVIPFKAGGGYDRYARIFAPNFEHKTGARVVVENSPGAGGTAGIKEIRDAAPDGHTIGLLNGATMLLKEHYAGEDYPRILDDFTILGRITRNHFVLATGENSRFDHYTDMIDADPPAVLGVTNFKTNMDISMATISNLIGMEHEVVAGFKGLSGRSLAVLRGDVDLLFGSAGSLYSRIETGELKPLLILAGQPLEQFPLLKSVPLLGGDDGVAALHAGKMGSDVSGSIAKANALEKFNSAGRIITAPLNLPEDLQTCLAETIHAILLSAQFEDEVSKSNMTLDAADAIEARGYLQEAAIGIENYLPAIREQVNKKAGEL